MQLRQTGQLNSALAAIQESRRLEEQLTETDTTWQPMNLVLALLREGSILSEDQDISLDRPQEAAAVFRQALNIATQLTKKDPDDYTRHQFKAEAARHLGDVLRHTDPESALRIYDDCIHSAREPGNTNINTRRQETRLLAGSSYALQTLHREAEGKRRLDQVFDLLRTTGDYPAPTIELASEADLALRALADFYAASGQPKKAAATWHDLLTRVDAGKPDPRNDLRDAVYLSNAWGGLAHALRQDGRAREAATWEAERRNLWEHWDNKLTNNTFVRRQLASARAN